MESVSFSASGRMGGLLALVAVLTASVARLIYESRGEV
jgi:hypothetical protein